MAVIAYCILLIVRVSSQEEMVGITARADIASMANKKLARYGAIEQFVSNAMRTYRCAVMLNISIPASSVLAPKPASGLLDYGNPGPKASNEVRGESFTHSKPFVCIVRTRELLCRYSTPARNNPFWGCN